METNAHRDYTCANTCLFTGEIIMSVARRSFRFTSFVFGSFVFFTIPAWAQRPVIPAPHAPAAPVHFAPPPVYHAPMMQPPVMRPPTIYSPIYNPPRFGITHTPGLGGSIVLPPVRPIRPPLRPTSPIIYYVYSPRFLYNDPRDNFCWWTSCDMFWPWLSGYTSISSPGPIAYAPQTVQTPVYVYGGEREDFPQLYLKDGTIVNATDYWVVDGQLHFKVLEAIGEKPVEQTIPFDDLDLQKTIDANTARGFRFVLRNAPYDEYVRDHPEPPPALTPEKK